MNEKTLEQWLDEMFSLDDMVGGIVVYAIPSPKLPSLVCEIRGGRGLQCKWTKEQQIEAYKGIIAHCHKIIARLQEKKPANE